MNLHTNHALSEIITGFMPAFFFGAQNNRSPYYLSTFSSLRSFLIFLGVSPSFDSVQLYPHSWTWSTPGYYFYWSPVVLVSISISSIGSILVSSLLGGKVSVSGFYISSVTGDVFGVSSWKSTTNISSKLEKN